ncbi:MAG: hypothetical protein K0S55_2154 [Clostridia bacterium]|jgi:uncharacterized membrane protein YadS|nr:hypothetical protein [Clostridia bacterium]
MAVGIIIGIKIFPKKFEKINSKVQVVSISILIFCMGVSLGGRDSFIRDLSALGIKSLIYSVLPIFFSVIAVYFLTKLFMEDNKKHNDNDINSDN